MRKLISIGIFALSLSGGVLAADVKLAEDNIYKCKDGGKIQKVWFDQTQVAAMTEPTETTSSRAVKQAQLRASGMTLVRQERGLSFWKQADGGTQTRDALADPKRNINNFLPVYRSAPSTGASYLVPSKGVIVQMKSNKEQELKDWAAKNNKTLKPLAGVAWVVDTDSGAESLSVAETLSNLNETETACPNWVREIHIR